MLNCILLGENMETRLKSSPRIFIGRKNENKLLNDLFEK
jgi:hypothetical protein